MHTKGAKRQYQTRARKDGAQATRFSVITAAATLFVRDGYGSTSIDAVAREAGVARATVFNSVGGKPALMKAAYQAAVVGGDDPRPPREGALGDRARSASTAGEVLDVYVEVLAEVFEAVAPLHQALVNAASTAPELRALLDELDNERHLGAVNIVALAAERGPLAGHLTPQHAADVLWVLSSPQLWQQLHGDRAWSRADFTAWLSQLLRSQLL